MSTIRRVFACLLAPILLVLPSIQISAQESRKGIKTVIREIHFSGDDYLARASQSEFDSLKLEASDGKVALYELSEHVRYLYMCNGYYKAEVETHSRSLASDSSEQSLSVDVHIQQNLQYRLGRLELTDQKVFSAEQLRALFPIKSGEVFDVEKIRKGFDNLRKIYGGRGYIEATPVPDTKADDAQAVVDLSINIDEGLQFRIRTISFSGDAGSDSRFQERVLKNLGFKPGDVYDPRLLEAFFNANHSWLPTGSTLENSLEIGQNTREGTLDLYFVFEER